MSRAICGIWILSGLFLIWWFRQTPEPAPMLTLAFTAIGIVMLVFTIEKTHQ